MTAAMVWTRHSPCFSDLLSSTIVQISPRVVEVQPDANEVECKKKAS